jgi:cytochrome o ubiquinol oxidase operon protein cyoD
MSDMQSQDQTDFGDTPPGEERLDGSGIAQGVLGYVVGLALAGALTVASFYASQTHLIWGGGVYAALIALAIGQIGVHLVFFLHISTGPESTNNVLALAFGVLIVILLLGGTLFIMSALNHAMPPMGQMMTQQP